MQKNLGHDIFSQFQLAARDPFTIAQGPSKGHQKTRSLALGCQRRWQLKLYRGLRQYIQDLQIILDSDLINGPEILRELHISISRQDRIVQPQCVECGKYTIPFKFCSSCDNVHYCSEACEMRLKFGHQKECRGLALPQMDKALHVEVHFGSDLGRNVEIYYQHQGRLSLQFRGQNLLKNILRFFMEQGKIKIEQNFVLEKVEKHLCLKKIQQGKLAGGTEAFIYSFSDICSIYEHNSFLGHLECWLLREGGIISHYVKEVHNNHLHLIYIFMCPF